MLRRQELARGALRRCSRAARALPSGAFELRCALLVLVLAVSGDADESSVAVVVVATVVVTIVVIVVIVIVVPLAGREAHLIVVIVVTLGRRLGLGGSLWLPDVQRHRTGDVGGGRCPCLGLSTGHRMARRLPQRAERCASQRQPRRPQAAGGG